MAEASVHRFAVLDALRGVAALVVAAEHLNARGPLFGQAFFHNGLFFVDFFFALSGFVIAASYADKLRSGFPPQRFLWLRVWRVWPVHLLVLGLYLAIELGGLNGRAAFGPEREVWQFFVQLVLLQSVIVGALYSWVLQSWSISVELVQYATAALLWRVRPHWWWQGWLALALIAALAMAFASEPIGLYHKLLRGFSGFGLGVCAFAAWQRWGSRLELASGRMMTLLEFACVLAIIASVQTAGDDPVFGLYALGFAFTVLIFAAERGAISRLLRRRLALFLGTISYSIYMVHTLIESGLASLAARAAGALGQGGVFVITGNANRPTLDPALGLWADLFSAALLFAVVLAAWLVFRLVEDPVRQWSRRQLAPSA